MRIKKLEYKIKKANKVYRDGNPMISDQEYDQLLDQLKELDPTNRLFKKGILEKSKESRKEELPVQMFSLDKVHDINELRKWLRLKKVSKLEDLVITPKYDGISLLVSEFKEKGVQKSWTRGDGITGQLCSNHYKELDEVFFDEPCFTYGEIMMKKDVFEKKYSKKFSNPRNLVAGKFNALKPDEDFGDLDYLRYGVVFEDSELNKLAKSEQLELINGFNRIKIPFKVIKVDYLHEEILQELFKEWSKDYMLDGLVIEIDKYDVREFLGRETNNNPAYARAYKGGFEEVKRAVVKEIHWKVSKQGYLKPVAEIEPIYLDGAQISRATLYNAKFVYDNNISGGCVVKIKRSGMVIPKVIEIVKRSSWKIVEHLTKCSSCNSDVEWNENSVELRCLNNNCPGKNLSNIVSFFRIMEVEEFNEPTILKCIQSGFDSIDKIMRMGIDDFMELEGFAKRSASNAYKNIHEKVDKVSLSKIQHASGCFEGIGEKILSSINNSGKSDGRLDQLIEIEGIAEKTAIAYMRGLNLFNEWILNIPVTIIDEKIKVKSDRLKDFSIVMTGFRDKDLEKIVVENGGKISSGVSKKITYLVYEGDKSSTKKRKAMELGINMVERKDFYKLIEE